MAPKKSPDPTDRHVGARVRMRRLVLGKSQSYLAEKLKLTFQQVQKYEKGANRIGASRLQQIADVLDVRVEFFFAGLSNAKAVTGEPDPSEDFLRDRDGVALMCVWAKLPEATRAALVALAEAVVFSKPVTTKRAA